MPSTRFFGSGIVAGGNDPGRSIFTWSLSSRLADVAIPGIRTTGPDTAVDVLADSMREGGLAIVVTEADRRPVGIVTTR